MKSYAAICYESEPDNSLDVEVYTLAAQGYVLRTNRDQAYEKACDVVSGRKVVRCASSNKPWIEYAKLFSAEAMSNASDNVHGRYAAICSILLGDKLDQPVEFCYFRGEKYKEHVLMICAANNIKVL